MKHTLFSKALSVLLVLTLVLALPVIGNADIPVTKITLSETIISLKPSETKQVIATVTPDDATNPGVTFTSNNTSVATVSTTGVITAVAGGSAVITASALDGSGVTAQCGVVVPKSVTGLTVSPMTCTLAVGGEQKLTTVVTPSDAADKSVTYSSSNTGVAVVSNEGRITAVSLGNAVITVTSCSDSSIIAACNVTVGIKVADISVTPSAITLETGKTYAFAADVEPTNATDTSVTWSSSDTAVATVSSIGVITTWKAGTANITATANDGSGIKGSAVVTVMGETVLPTLVSNITLSDTSLTLKAGGSKQLTAVVTPADATDPTYKYTSSNATVATVSNDGLVTAVGPGTATITCASNDGGATASCSVTVTTPVSAIAVNPSNLVVGVSENKQLTVTFTPSNATNKNVGYQSSNTAVAVVSNTGIVTGVANGTAVITVVSADDASKITTCSVTVGTAVTKIDITPAAISLKTGSVYALEAAVSPANATNPKVIWASSDDSIAQVNASGVVTLYKAGTVVIVAKAADGSGVQGSCTFTVTGDPVDTPTPTATPTPTPTPGPTTAPSGSTARVNTVKGGLNLRKSANGSAKILTVIPQNAYFTVLTYGPEWCYAYYNGNYGYVMTKFVSFDLTPGTVTPTPTPTGSGSYTAYVDTVEGGLNVRTAKDTSSKRLCVIPKGMSFTVLTYGADWCYVYYNGVYGYAMTKFIAIGAAPITPTPTATSSGSIVAYGKVTTASGGLNMRETASPGATVLQVIPRNAWCDIYTTGSTWCYVSYNGIKGWVMTKFLTVSASKTETAAPTTPIPSPTSAKVTTASGALNLRASASTSAKVLDKIPQNATITVLSKGSTWTKVSYNSKIGYVMTKYLTFIY